MLRHAKWFGARAAGLQSAVMIIRVLRYVYMWIIYKYGILFIYWIFYRDMQIWTPSWQPLRPFALELIVEKSLASAGLPLSPGDGLRRVFESISGGCILQVHIVNIFNFIKKNYVKTRSCFFVFISIFDFTKKWARISHFTKKNWPRIFDFTTIC